jgi:hypothetical protein
MDEEEVEVEDIGGRFGIGGAACSATRLLYATMELDGE